MERWATADEIHAARARFEDAIPGWRRPRAHGLGLVPSGAVVGPEHFPLTNRGEHVLPGVVLATVVGHARGTAAYPVSREQLAQAIALLVPAEACDVYTHPNLWTWRDTYLPVLAQDPGASLWAVFVDTQDTPHDESAGAIQAFRSAVEQAAPETP